MTTKDQSSISGDPTIRSLNVKMISHGHPQSTGNKHKSKAASIEAETNIMSQLNGSLPNNSWDKEKYGENDLTPK